MILVSRLFHRGKSQRQEPLKERMCIHGWNFDKNGQCPKCAAPVLQALINSPRAKHYSDEIERLLNIVIKE